MTPSLSDEQRSTTVMDFITYYINGKVKITDYIPLTWYLNDKDIKMLANMKPTGVETNIVGGHYIKTSTGLYTENDAKKYFDWLMSVVAGSIKASEEITNEASDQLFSLLFMMRDKIQITKETQLLAPYDWQALFTSFDKRLTDMRNIIDKGDKDIIEVLKPILEMMKRNTKLLDALQKENEKVFGKGSAQ